MDLHLLHIGAGAPTTLEQFLAWLPFLAAPPTAWLLHRHTRRRLSNQRRPSALRRAWSGDEPI